MVKVVLCGPPHSGKSVLRHALVGAVRALTAGGVYCYVITANPDGEGAPYQEAVGAFPELAAAYKTAYKAALRGEGETAFIPERVALWEEWVRNTPVPLALVDIGGRIDDSNRRICQHATHAIILGRDDASLTEWTQFCQGEKMQLGIVARILSDYHAPTDEINPTADPLTGRLRRLERGEPTADRPAVRVIAQRLIDMVTSPRS